MKSRFRKKTLGSLLDGRGESWGVPAGFIRRLRWSLEGEGKLADHRRGKARQTEDIGGGGGLRTSVDHRQAREATRQGQASCPSLQAAKHRLFVKNPGGKWKKKGAIRLGKGAGEKQWETSLGPKGWNWCVGSWSVRERRGFYAGLAFTYVNLEHNAFFCSYLIFWIGYCIYQWFTIQSVWKSCRKDSSNILDTCFPSLCVNLILTSFKGCVMILQEKKM